MILKTKVREVGLKEEVKTHKIKVVQQTDRYVGRERVKDAEIK